MMNEFPYTDAHQLNLDWILERIKSYVTSVDGKTGDVAILPLGGSGGMSLHKLNNTDYSCVWEYENYNTLLNLPTINNVLVSGSKSLDDFGIASTNDVSELYDNILNAISKTWHKTTLGIFQQGSIDAAYGYNVTNAKRIRTSTFINTDMLISCITVTGYEFNVYAYEQDGAYIGCIQTSGDFGKSSSVQYVKKFLFPTTYKYRIVARRVDNTNISTSEAINIHFNIPGNDFADRAIFTDETDFTFDQRFGITWFTEGIAINGSGEETAQTGSIASEWVKCWNGNQVISNVVLNNNQGYNYIAFYDENKNFLSRAGGWHIYSVTADIPSKAYYLRVSLSYIGGASNVSQYFFQINGVPAIKKTPKNTMYILGDSISAGYYSLYTADVPVGVTPAVSYSDGTCAIWDKTLEHNYWRIANDWFWRQNMVNIAYPGQGYYRTASNNKNGVDVVNDNSFSDAGLIIVAWGFNDWHYNQQRGDHNLIDANEPYATQSTSTAQINTINRAIWYCLGVLIDKAPNAKIVVQTPMNGWRYGGDFSTYWSINYALSNSDTLKDIHDDIVYWCDYYGLQYVDMTFNNSVVNRCNIQTTILDGSHPTAEAHKQLARTVGYLIGY